MHMYNFLCSDSLLYFFLFLSTLHSVYTRDCSCTAKRLGVKIICSSQQIKDTRICAVSCSTSRGVEVYSNTTLSGNYI